MSEQTGTFYAVSVGPGDPELLTLQAVRVLENTPVIAAPQTASGQMLALDIARGAAECDRIITIDGAALAETEAAE